LQNLEIEGRAQGPVAEPERTEWKRFLLDLTETLVLAVVLFLGINAVSARVRVDGTSMNPTLQNGEFVLVSRLAYKIHAPERGDIIVFRSTTDELDLIKRVIGLPGDEVLVESGRVIVNGQALEEPYITAPPSYSGSWQVPEGYLFVLGDNRNNSSDSHAWGVLPLKNVIGKGLVIYWPPNEWDLINHIQIAVAAP
jgi:signal peptidase I